MPENRSHFMCSGSAACAARDTTVILTPVPRLNVTGDFASAPPTVYDFQAGEASSGLSVKLTIGL